MRVHIYKDEEIIAEGIEVNGTLYVHYYNSPYASTMVYKFGEWPKGCKFVYEEEQK